MTKNLVAMFAAVVLALPGVSLASSYDYVNIHGKLGMVEAASAIEALAMVTAMPDTLHTGVMLHQGLLKAGEIYGNIYQYVSAGGATNTVVSPTADGAAMANPAVPSSELTVVATITGGVTTTK